MSQVPEGKRERQDLWIPGLFVAFFVGLAALQGWFIYVAQSSFSGLVTDQQMQKDDEGEDWQARFSFSQTASLEGTIELSIRDQHGSPLDSDTLRATIERGTRFPQSIPVAFVRTHAGNYRAELRLPLAGPWTLRAHITDGQRTVERIATIEVLP